MKLKYEVLGENLLHFIICQLAQSFKVKKNAEGHLLLLKRGNIIRAIFLPFQDFLQPYILRSKIDKTSILYYFSAATSFLRSAVAYDITLRFYIFIFMAQIYASIIATATFLVACDVVSTVFINFTSYCGVYNPRFATSQSTVTS